MTESFEENFEPKWMSVINASCRVHELTTPDLVRCNVPSAAYAYALKRERETPADTFPLEDMLDASDFIQQLGVLDSSFTAAEQRKEENLLMAAIRQNHHLNIQKWLADLQQERTNLRAQLQSILVS